MSLRRLGGAGGPGRRGRADLAEDLADLWTSDKVTLLSEYGPCCVVSEGWMGQAEGHVARDGQGAVSLRRQGRISSDWTVHSHRVIRRLTFMVSSRTVSSSRGAGAVRFGWPDTGLPSTRGDGLGPPTSCGRAGVVDRSLAAVDRRGDGLAEADLAACAARRVARRDWASIRAAVGRGKVKSESAQVKAEEFEGPRQGSGECTTGLQVGRSLVWPI